MNRSKIISSYLFSVYLLLISFHNFFCSAPKYDEDFLKEEEDNFYQNIIVHHATDSTINLKMDSINAQINSLDRLFQLLSEAELIKKIDSIQKDLAEIKRNISSPVLYDKFEKKDTLINHTTDLSKRIENVENKLKSISEKKGNPITKKDEKKQEKKLDFKDINTFDDFNTTYDYAINLFKIRKYDEAINTFENLSHARLQKHELVDNIFYWIGECHYAKGNYGPAIENFKRVLNIPKANKIDDALMMVGLSYEKLNKIEEARESYQRLIDTQPKSRFVPKAKEKLKILI